MPTSMPTFEELRALRDQPGADQEKLSSMEHRAFARQWVQENPLVAVPSLAVATPLYAGAKALGLMSQDPNDDLLSHSGAAVVGEKVYVTPS